MNTLATANEGKFVKTIFPKKVHQSCAIVVEKSWFKWFIVCVILLAGAQVGLETYMEETAENKKFFNTINTIIIIVFSFEAIIKILAEGNDPLHYFKNGWNKFDFLILVVCLLPINSGYVTVVRMIRLFRVLRLFSALPQLRLLTIALIKSIPSIGNIMILLLLHFYIFGAMATILFSQNDPIHFGTLHISILSLFRAATLEDWTDLMYINMYGCANYGYEGADAALCTNSLAMPIVSAIFFSFFVLSGSMIILNLFVGVIMNGMEESKSEIMIQELVNKQALKGELSTHEEIVLIEAELQQLSSQMRTLNTKLYKLLSKVKEEL